ncbi:MAG: VOC family protein [Erysipelotrichaceae bacterium]|nr:VOC family protein [Solobacterium sp.]MDO4192196.1 VOC family protein [Erysipelotrichaceae bacterium]MDO5120734.1 VOC family protein [Erysipelotrichaceae bacterium]
MDLGLIGLQHIGLPAQNVEETAAFFRKLGFKDSFIKKTMDENVCFVEAAGVIFEIYQRNETAGRPGAIDHIALNTTKVEEAYRYCVEQGFEFVDGGIHQNDFWENGTKYFTIIGPNREKIEFSQYL